MSKHLWLYWLPLLFLPNLGFATETPFGVLEVSDYLIVPYIVLVFWGLQTSRLDRLKSFDRRYIHYLIPTLLMFVWWAFLSTMTIYFRYDYADLNQTYFSLLKIGKLSLYVFAAVLTIAALSRLDEAGKQKFLWSLVASGTLVGLTLLISGNAIENLLPWQSEELTGEVFKQNPTSVMMSLFVVYFVGMLINENGTTSWRRLTFFALIIMVFGFFNATGRGGWIAAMVGVTYIGLRIEPQKTARILFAGLIAVAFAYGQIPAFRTEVDKTLWPDPEFLEQYNAGVAGVDDGARITTWLNESAKLIDDPLLGRGFFHRGGRSGLFWTGSHNFFIQMFLETGVLGGILILVVIRQMWRHASSELSVQNKLEVPLKASLVAAIAGGLGGEYFYGGMVTFTLFMTYASVGCLKSKRIVQDEQALAQTFTEPSLETK